MSNTVTNEPTTITCPDWCTAATPGGCSGWHQTDALIVQISQKTMPAVPDAPNMNDCGDAVTVEVTVEQKHRHPDDQIRAWPIGVVIAAEDLEYALLTAAEAEALTQALVTATAMLRGIEADR